MAVAPALKVPSQFGLLFRQVQQVAQLQHLGGLFFDQWIQKEVAVLML